MRISDWSSDVCSSDLGPVKQIIEAPREDYTRQLVSVRQIQKQEAPEQSDALLRIDRVDAAYSNPFKVLHDVRLHVPRGQTVPVVGESGPGESPPARVIKIGRAPCGARVCKHVYN